MRKDVGMNKEEMKEIIRRLRTDPHQIVTDDEKQREEKKFEREVMESIFTRASDSRTICR
jgi:low affinity Fe/Cu permease